MKKFKITITGDMSIVDIFKMLDTLEQIKEVNIFETKLEDKGGERVNNNDGNVVYDTLLGRFRSIKNK